MAPRKKPAPATDVRVQMRLSSVVVERVDRQAVALGLTRSQYMAYLVGQTSLQTDRTEAAVPQGVAALLTSLGQAAGDE